MVSNGNPIGIAVVGAGAAGLMAALHAARSGAHNVVVLEGNRRPGAKILVSGGGRCNLTNQQVEPRHYNGSTPNAIRKILLGFDVPNTLALFADLGLETKVEDGGKILPRDDRARSVLDALLSGIRAAGVELRCDHRIEALTRADAGFALAGRWGRLRAERVILATGGRSLPKSGSDGAGYEFAAALGHRLTPHIFPALVPLLLPDHHPLTALSGLTRDVALTLAESPAGPRVKVRGSLLCTHFGLSGPAVLDLSRHWIARRLDGGTDDPRIDWLPDLASADLDRTLQTLKSRTIGTDLRLRLPDRLVQVICSAAGVDASVRGGDLTRGQRRAVVEATKAMPAPVRGDRGFRTAEVTAGGVPLSQLDLRTLESRLCPGLYLCGEICDVDGVIGGYNFQWAWSSGAVAGRGAGGVAR